MIVEVVVLPDGSLREVRVTSTSGYAVLDQAALAALRLWRFKPGTRGGDPVTSKVRVPVRFKLVK